MVKEELKEVEVKKVIKDLERISNKIIKEDAKILAELSLR